MTVPEEYKKTVKSALNMLAYAENTKKALADKLRQKGYSPESVEFAVEYVVGKKLLDEERYLYRLVENLARQKCYGEKRIRMEIYHKGFDEEVVKNCLEDAFSQVDFYENCYRFAAKSYNGDKEKLFAKLMRMGHSTERAGAVCKRVASEQNEDADI